MRQLVTSKPEIIPRIWLPISLPRPDCRGDPWRLSPMLNDKIDLDCACYMCAYFRAPLACRLDWSCVALKCSLLFIALK